LSHAHHHPSAHLGAKIARLPTALLYLPLAILGAVAAYELSAGMLALLAIGLGMILALVSRIQTPPCPRAASAETPRGLPLGDGGCFPGKMAVRRSPPSATSPARVMDGGSFEKHLL